MANQIGVLLTLDPAFGNNVSVFISISFDSSFMAILEFVRDYFSSTGYDICNLESIYN